MVRRRQVLLPQNVKMSLEGEKGNKEDVITVYF